MSMNPLEKLLVGITALSFIISPITCLSSYVFGDEKKQTAPWKEVSKVRDLTVEEMLNIGNTGYTGLVTICNQEMRFEGYTADKHVDDNLYQVLENLAQGFVQKGIRFSGFKLPQLLDKPYNFTPNQIKEFMYEKWKIKISDLPTTIMYKDGKEFDRFTGGPVSGEPKPGITWVNLCIQTATYWINYNLLGERELEDKEKENCYLLFEGKMFTKHWRSVNCE